MKAQRDTALERLDAYVRRELEDDAADQYEDDLFARALGGAAPELDFRSGLERAFQSMVAKGNLYGWLTRRELEQVVNRGLRVFRYDLDLANPVPPELPAEFDLLVTRIALDLTGVHRLEVEVFTPEGKLLKRMPEVTFDPEDGALYACCEADLARAANSVKSITKLWGEDDAGRRLLGVIGP